MIKLDYHQQRANLVDAEELLKGAFATDVRPVIEAWRRSHKLPRIRSPGTGSPAIRSKLKRTAPRRTPGTVTSYA